MLAIMGPSGAGKTTLLSLLSKRNSPTLNVKGDVRDPVYVDFSEWARVQPEKLL